MASEALSNLCFRPERSRPIWRNRHTGTEVTVVDLAVNDHGGFQGGCRQHVVITDEPGPPGPPSPRDLSGRGPRGANVYPLWSWLEHWEPTGRYVDWNAEAEPTPEQRWRQRALEAERELRQVREALAVLGLSPATGGSL